MTWLEEAAYEVCPTVSASPPTQSEEQLKEPEESRQEDEEGGKQG